MSDSPMGIRPDESADDYRNRVIDPISDSFCAAKWYNATIWLGHGQTTSCHHPPSHQIDVDELVDNPSAIHNTKHKKKMRKLMQAGVRPAECEYCWKIEDMIVDSDGKRPVSDRTYKTAIYTDAAIEEISVADPDENTALKTLEIAFDRTCNFACTYCNPAYSTTWVKNIRKHGGYQGIKSDARSHFTDDAPYADPFEKLEFNPYEDAFWEWWPEISQTLDEIRITGGEPMMSDGVWKLFDWFEANQDSKMRFAINSNLGGKDSLINKLIDASHFVNHLDIYTSCEAFGAQAEYIRDGLEFTKWQANCEKLLTHGRIKSLNMMMTINALCLDSITEFLDWILEFKTKHGEYSLVISLNIMRFPAFQSALTLSEELRSMYHDELLAWYEEHKNGGLLIEWEVGQISRLIEYLNIVKTPHANTPERPLLEHDFKVFYKQYDERQGHNFAETFPRLVPWYNSLNTLIMTDRDAVGVQLPKER